MQDYCRQALVTFSLLFVLSACTATTQTNKSETPSNWHDLFDGSSVDNWRTYQQSDIAPGWRIIGDELVLSEKNAGDIISRTQYADFELQLDWNVAEGGNSGIFVRADERGKHIYSHALEIQILDNQRHPDSKLATRRSGSLYDLQASSAASQLPAEQWNHVRIVFKGTHLQVWQNSVQTVDIQIGSQAWQKALAQSKFKDWPNYGLNTQGYIGLQDHGDRVAFKNIKIKSL